MESQDMLGSGRARSLELWSSERCWGQELWSHGVTSDAGARKSQKTRVMDSQYMLGSGIVRSKESWSRERYWGQGESAWS